MASKLEKFRNAAKQREEGIKQEEKNDRLVDEMQESVLEGQKKAEEPGKETVQEIKPEKEKKSEPSVKKEVRHRDKGYKGRVPKEYTRGAVENTITLHITITADADMETAKKVAGVKGKNKSTFIRMAMDAFLELKPSIYDKLIETADEKNVTVGSIINEALSKQFKSSDIEDEAEE